MKTRAALALVAAWIPLSASAGEACPASVAKALDRAEAKLVSCAIQSGSIFAVQDYKGAQQKYAGITVSVYSAEGFSPEAVPVAVQDGLGEKALTFKFHGKLVDHWMVDGSKPGIVLLLFNPPNAAIFGTFRFDAATKKLEKTSHDVAVDAGKIPSISKSGILIVTDHRYRFDDGKFTPIR